MTRWDYAPGNCRLPDPQSPRGSRDHRLWGRDFENDFSIVGSVSQSVSMPATH
jgi:hypothetical protein